MLEQSSEEIKGDEKFHPAEHKTNQPVSNKQICVEPTKLVRTK